mgnify:CR=1 FL=1
MDVKIDKNSWNVPKIFRLIQNKGNVPEREMYHTLNMGIGMVLVVDSKDIDSTREALSKFGFKSWVIGEVFKGNKEVII